MYARSTTIQADPSRIDEGITYVRDEVTPALTNIDGCIGLSMMIDRESGRCITTTAWHDEESMRASDARVRPLRDRAGEVFGGRPQVDVWEIAVLHRMDEAGQGACVRATWTRTAEDRLQEAIDTYRTIVLPTTEALPGFRSASLFVDRKSGRSVSSVTYDSHESLVRSREAAAARRAAIQERGLEVLEVAEFDLVLAHLRVPETV